MRICAYCGSDSQFTKEHIFPRCLYKRTPDHDAQYLRSKFVGGQPTIGDVCIHCNNGSLSQLDSYICELFDLYLCRTVLRGQTIDFRYDFHRLSRWLLKTSYNSARSSRGNPDIKPLAEYAQYILGNSTCPSKLGIYVQLVVPYVIPDWLKSSGHDFGEYSDYLPPENDRIAKIAIQDSSLPIGLCRLVAIKSFYFYLIAPSSMDISEKRWKQALHILLADLGNPVKLGYNRTRITLYASNMDALEVMERSAVMYNKEYRSNFQKLIETRPNGVGPTA